MADRSNSERLKGFCNGQTDRWTEICNSRVAFAAENCRIRKYVLHLHICNSNKYVSYCSKEYGFVRFVKTFPCVAVYMSSLTNMAIAVDRYQVIVRTQSLQVINIQPLHFQLIA